MTEKELKQLFIKAVKSRASKQEPLLKQVFLFSRMCLIIGLFHCTGSQMLEVIKRLCVYSCSAGIFEVILCLLVSGVSWFEMCSA